MTRRSASVRVAGGALAVIVATMLTGCFSNPLDAIVEKATEETAQNAAEDVIEGITDGEVGVEFGEVPDGFPAEIPLVSENVLQGMKLEGGMMVIVSDPRSMDELTAQVKEDFSGWEEITWTDLDEIVSGTYMKDESLSVSVGIFAASGGDDATVSYTVSTLEG